MSSVLVPSAFNVRAPLPSGDVFVMNTLTDAQAIVPPDVAALVSADGVTIDALDAERAGEAAALAEHGFFVADPHAELAALEARFSEFRDDTSELRVTVLTTLQCNFACEYCYQGDHGPASMPGEKMSAATAERVAAWIGDELARLNPERLVLTFFGGEPLLNLPALHLIAARAATAAAERGAGFGFTIITNGLLLTPDVVEPLLPLGLRAVKITLDGDRETHDRQRHLRGGQGTFDRIVENMRRVARLVPLSIGGNFDASTVDRYPSLLAFLKEQEFAPYIIDVAFKPVIAPAGPSGRPGIIPLTPVRDGQATTAGSCASVTGPGGSICDSCHFVDEQMAYLQRETRRHGFATLDGVHMGPCELYRRHSHTIGPDGSLYACPGFTGDHAQSVGHIDRKPDLLQSVTAERFARLAPWRQCGDCAFIPVCGGGCAVAAQSEHGDMHAPSCHKRAFESALINLAEQQATAAGGEQSCVSPS